eukprot:559603-Rhodomonas_salina.1
MSGTELAYGTLMLRDVRHRASYPLLRCAPKIERDKQAALRKIGLVNSAIPLRPSGVNSATLLRQPCYPLRHSELRLPVAVSVSNCCVCSHVRYLLLLATYACAMACPVLTARMLLYQDGGGFDGSGVPVQDPEGVRQPSAAQGTGPVLTGTETSTGPATGTLLSTGWVTGTKLSTGPAAALGTASSSFLYVE